MLWIETPSNPLLRITDIERSPLSEASGRFTVVDNTFLSPMATAAHTRSGPGRHSTTKYLMSQRVVAARW